MNKSVTIKSNNVEATIEALGAQMVSLKKGEKEILWEGDPNVWGFHAPVLFPICGSLKDDKFIYEGKEYHLMKHGFAKTSMFEIESTKDDEAVFLLSANEETKKMYPFDFEYRIIYKVEDGKINIENRITNKGEKPMYATVGYHEAYACPEGIEAYSVIFEHEESFDITNLIGPLLDYSTTNLGKGRELPLKYEYFDIIDSLVFSGLKSRKAILKNNITNESITIDFDGADSFLVWTLKGAKYICLEPWCGLPDYCDSNYDITAKKAMLKIEANSSASKYHSITVN